MPIPALPAKLAILRVHPDRILRPRLSNLLHDGLGRILTLVSASAGSGKTTLVSMWTRHRDRQLGERGQACSFVSLTTMARWRCYDE
jgi:LuxR family maltose regulon positive regulatory protein